MFLKNVVMFASIVNSLIISDNVMAADRVQYSTIINKYKKGFRVDRCLRTFANINSVAIGNCTAQGGAADYVSMRQWEIVKQSNDFYFIKNKYKKDAGRGQCLRSVRENNDLAVGDCDSNGDESDDNSMRLWKIVENGNRAILQNKYKLDAGKPNCIRTFHNNSSISLDECHAKGGPTNYTSMRQWFSDAFPFDKRWGPTGIVRIKYTIPGTPESGFNRIAFPMRVEKDPQERGFFYSMGYEFINGNEGYIGLQPRVQNSGLAVFSVFGSGVKPIAPHCTRSADHREGSSCSKIINLVFGHTYNLTVKRDDKDSKIWRGYVEDTVSGEVNEIGAWQPREGSEGLKGSNGGFVEYYPPINSCSKIPYTESFFGSPIANSDISGSLEKPHIYGKCKELVEFNTQESIGGWDIRLEGK